MLVRVIRGADSKFEVDSLIPLSHDAMSTKENEAAPITHKLLGLERFGFNKWNWHAKTEFQVSMKIFMLIMVVFPPYL